MATPWHAMLPHTVAERLEADPGTGLTDEEAALRLQRIGPNALPQLGSPSLLRVFLSQYRSPLVLLLIAAAVLAFVLGHRTDAWVILAIVTVNALLGTLQEGRAERTLAALRKLSASQARVVRGGRQLVIDAHTLVPGDVLILAAGDAIAADARLVEAASLEVVAAALTGEATPVPKAAATEPEDTAMADRGSMVYAATHVTAGRGRAVVVATGLATEVGKIASLTANAAEPITPLARRINELGHIVTYAGIGTSALVVLIGALRKMPMNNVLMVAASQLVAMVPEGLPVAVTVSLALGARRIARRGALVRRLAAVETLGSTTLICSDKTGTLTRNELSVTAAHLASGRTLDVTGAGYAPEGQVAEHGVAPDPNDPDVRSLAEAGALCNDARLVAPASGEPGWRAIGDPTEAALLAFAAKAGVNVDALRAGTRRLAEVPFDAQTRMMATEHERAGRAFIVLKGAPEVVLARCSSRQIAGRAVALDEAGRRALQAGWVTLALRGLRLLALAVVPSGGELRRGLGEVHGATLLGIVGQHDPPREGAREAIATCHAAGIRVMMLTGDHEETASAVARALGILRDKERVLTGADIARRDDDALARVLGDVSVFARVHPAQKLRIVQALQKRGEVVAMTGDGVNDAPALASADVGVAMGRAGTEVAKMAAKVVLTDDNFATLVRAIEEGRALHHNLKKLILYAVSTAIAGVLILVLALAVGLPAPLAAVHVLWINLVTDGVVALPLSTGAPDMGLMRRPPVPPREPLLTKRVLLRTAVMVPSMVLSTLGWFVWRTRAGVPFAQASTEAFTVLAMCQWWNALNCRSDTASALRLSLRTDRWLLLGIGLGVLLQGFAVYTPIGNRLLHALPLSAGELGGAALAASVVLWAEELRKLLSRWRGRGQPRPVAGGLRRGSPLTAARYG